MTCPGLYNMSKMVSHSRVPKHPPEELKAGGPPHFPHKGEGSFTKFHNLSGWSLPSVAGSRVE